MIEKKLFIEQYKAIYARFTEITNSNIQQSEKYDKYDELICDIETLISVLPSVQGIDIKDWKRKLIAFKNDVFNEMVLLQDHTEFGY